MQNEKLLKIKFNYIKASLETPKLVQEENWSRPKTKLYKNKIIVKRLPSKFLFYPSQKLFFTFCESSS
jgi:hypothetical protein